MEIGWQSSSLAPLFPVFAGRLKLTPTDIVLEGFYAPPGGEFGAVLDRAFLNIAARGTARWFLDKAARALSIGPAPATSTRAPRHRPAPRERAPPATSRATIFQATRPDPVQLHGLAVMHESCGNGT
jgi:hypothetical protein